MTLDPLAQRQVNLGPAGFFRAEAESPAGNQVVVKAGFIFAGAYRVYDRFTAGDQTTTGFSSVSGAGFKRYDLVYVDASGAVQIAMGTEVGLASPTFVGAPGFTSGPDLPDQAVPVAYVMVDEPGAVTVVSTDISAIAGVFYLSRDLDGYLVDKGSLGSPPTGASTVVTSLFSAETPGGGTSVRGVVTSPPSNYVSIVNQNGDELKHTTVPSRIYGRITYSATVWTLSYYYTDASGVETVVAAIETETEGGAPTNLRLIGTPKVYSRNDPARPLFDSSVYRLSDQLVGDIPTATTTVQGKVLAAPSSPAAPQAGAVNVATNLGSPVAGGPFYKLNFTAGGATAGPAGELNIAAAGPPGPPGPGGPTGPTGPGGPPGPGFSSQGPFQIGPTHSAVPSSGTDVFSFGFTVRFYMVCIATHNTGGFASGDVNITSVTPSGTQVSVGWSLTTGDDIMTVGCSAAG